MRLLNRYRVKKPFVLVSSARNWRTKNLGSALLALERLRKEAGVIFQTVMYGSTPIPTFKSDDSLNVHHVGYVDSEDLAALFRHAHAFVMPSLYEGFALPLVEAMSCGCPVIASDRGSLPEIAGAGAQCFDPFDIKGMANCSVLCCVVLELQQKRSNA